MIKTTILISNKFMSAILQCHAGSQSVPIQTEPMTSRSIAQKHDATVGNYLWPINFFWFTQLNQEALNCFTPGQVQTKPTIGLNLSREGSVVALQSAPSPCNQSHYLAISPIIALLTAHRLTISLTSGLAVSLVALQPTSSP